jgi:hypothetical protein
MIVQAGRKQTPTRVKVVALYERATGNIVHTHIVVMHEGGRDVADEEVIGTALEEAARLGHTVDQLDTKLSTDPEHTVRPHRIDTNTGEFVALELPELKVQEPPTREGY